MLLVLLEGHHPGEFFDGAGHGSEGLADFVSNGRGQTAHSGHSFLGGDFLFEKAQFSEVLKIKNIAAAARVAGAQGGDRDTQVALVPAGDANFDFAPQGEFFGEGGHIVLPEILTYFAQIPPAQFRKGLAKDFLAGAIEKNDAAFHVRGDQAAAHGVDDVGGEILQFEQLFALFLQFAALAAQRMRQQAGEIGNGEESQGIAEEPHTHVFQRWRGQGGLRETPELHEFGKAAERRQAKGRDHESRLATEQDAGDNDDQKIKRAEITVLETRSVDDAADHDDVAGNLERAEPGGLGKQTHKDQVQDGDGDPKNDGGKKITGSGRGGDILGPDHADPEDQRDQQEADARAPVPPFAPI